MDHYSEIWYQSAEGLRLFARDYPAATGSGSEPLTLLCMPGLTRNSADFEPLCAYLAPHYRLVVADQRGRGRSQWDPVPANYQPATYVQDMFHLIDQLALSNVVLVGTSLGGLMAMMMNAMRPGFFRGVILNDIGPVLNPDGLERIKRYVGKTRPPANWEEAVENTRLLNEAAFPDFSAADWRTFARRLYDDDEAGLPVLLYDPAISQPINADDDNAVPPDLWPVFEQLLAVPTLLVRGVLSDILSAETRAEMQRRKPDLQVAEVERVGHAPILDEAAARAAIETFLAGLEPAG